MVPKRQCCTALSHCTYCKRLGILLQNLGYRNTIFLNFVQSRKTCGSSSFSVAFPQSVRSQTAFIIFLHKTGFALRLREGQECDRQLHGEGNKVCLGFLLTAGRFLSFGSGRTSWMTHRKHSQCSISLSQNPELLLQPPLVISQPKEKMLKLP